ncbi:MAG: spermidine synthase-like protein [Nevskia sp.]|nr:spermidine synthase-like protein [Nevskia sp.]
MQADEILNPDDYGSPAAYVRLGGRGTVDGSAEVGSDAKPFVLDDGLIRTLHFTTAFVQSEMNIGQPDMLILRYTRKMMAFLLFCPRPEHVIIVGLGGGSLTKFCYRQLPRARITTVEIDEDVIKWAHLFQVPVDRQRISIVHADATEYFAATEERADVILVDGCDAHGTAPVFCNESFYRNLRARLRPRGVLVVNLVGSAEVVKIHQHFIAAVFASRLVVLDVSNEGNRVAFAFNDPWRPPDWVDMHRDAKRLLRRHGLDFPAFARKLQRSYERQAIGTPRIADQAAWKVEK